ncbi:MAG: SprB repeat-containing protein, partial [Saprospiraceae bacterium]|nr:SprB repeat-containing protein [Saprospiraceae bacterium]
IDLTTSGGTGALSYHWSNGAATQDIFGLTAGTYSVTISDASGSCPLVKFYEVTAPSAMSLSANVEDMLCPYFANGSIELLVGGGEAPFSYQWSNGKTQRILQDLYQGSYSVTVTDGAGCTSTASFEVENNNSIMPVVMVTNSSNPGKADGSLMMSAINGGTGPFSFAWNNGATTMNLMNLLPGDYVVTITDGLGCQHVFGYEVFGLFTTTVEAGSSLMDVKAFPNPIRSGETFDLAFTMQMAEKITATIIAADGKIVRKERFQLTAGQSYRQMASPTANGFYILHFEVDGQPAGRLKLLVQ